MKRLCISWGDPSNNYENDEITVYIDGEEYQLVKSEDSITGNYLWTCYIKLEEGVHELKCEKGFTGPAYITTEEYIWNIYKDEIIAQNDIKMQAANNSASAEEFEDSIIQSQLENSGTLILERNREPHEENLPNFIICGLLFALMIAILIKMKNKAKLIALIPIIAILITAKPILADLTRAVELKNFYNGKSRWTYWNIDKKTIQDYDDAMALVKANDPKKEFDVSDMISDYINKMTSYYKFRNPRIPTLGDSEVLDNQFTKIFLPEDCSFLEEEFEDLDLSINTFEPDLVQMLERTFKHNDSYPFWTITPEQVKKFGSSDIDNVYRIDLPFNCVFEFRCPEAKRNNIHVKSVDLKELDKNDPLSHAYLIDDKGSRIPISVYFDIKEGLNKNIMTLNIRDGVLFPERVPAFCKISHQNQ